MTMETCQLVKSSLDTFSPIDFDKLRESTQSIGPLRMSQPGNPYTIEVEVIPCSCADEGCDEQVVIVRRKNGLFSIRWILSQDQLLEYESLDEFRTHVLAGALDDTCGERQIIEHDVEQVFGMHHSEVEPVTCFCSACAEAIGAGELSKRMLLSQLALRLTVRQTCLEEAEEIFGEDGRDFVSAAFDLGYHMGRLYSEYQVKEDIEEHAISGIVFEELKTKRARMAGAKSSGKRTERITELLTHMERLAAGSPAVLRIGPTALAKMACQDASTENPTLWSQGGGQVEEYLGLIRRGEAGKDEQRRYLTLFPPKSAPCSKTA